MESATLGESGLPELTHPFSENGSYWCFISAMDIISNRMTLAFTPVLSGQAQWCPATALLLIQKNTNL